jgi:signal peptidase
MGLQGYVVLSGSMEPVYHTGSVIYVQSKVDASALEEGQIITFRLTGDTIATHRIIEVVEENGAVRYRTKGDANEVADGSLVDPAQVIGTPSFRFPIWALPLHISSPRKEDTQQSLSGRYCC